MNIMPNNLERQFSLHASEYEAKALEVLRSGLAQNIVSGLRADWMLFGSASDC